MKKYIMLILTCVMFITSIIPVHAEPIENNEWYEVKEEVASEGDFSTEIEPYTKYLMNVHITLSKKGANQLAMRADVFCSAVVKKIDIKFTLQKKSGSTWVNIAETTAMDSNVSSTNKSVISGALATGTYRAVASAKVTDANGYAESLSSFSGAVIID